MDIARVDCGRERSTGGCGGRKRTGVTEGKRETESLLCRLEGQGESVTQSPGNLKPGAWGRMRLQRDTGLGATDMSNLPSALPL